MFGRNLTGPEEKEEDRRQFASQITGLTGVQQKPAINKVIQDPPSGELPVQRMLTIDGFNGAEPFGPYSRAQILLYDTYIVPLLERYGYKSYGIKTQAVRFNADNNLSYPSMDSFLEYFGKWLGTQTRATRTGTTPVLKQFSISGMSRPSWPKKLREELGAMPGDNIRHVVRNAKFKRALVIQEARSGIFARNYFLDMAVSLDIPVNDGIAYDVLLNAIYHKLYLNRENLFAGGGPFNQIIGLAADPVKQYGEQLMALDQEVDPYVALDNVKSLVTTAASMVHSTEKGDVLKYIHSFVDELKGLLSSPCTAEEAGGLISEIGLGFGFDLVDGRVVADREDIALRQARLLRAENGLNEYIASNGEVGNLEEIFQGFLGINAPSPMAVDEPVGSPAEGSGIGDPMMLD
ncbi:MAG: hypothetical protein JW712_03355 [Dehalococcoidales bacterium]|nr:hypothetical protein [Dehalococcoidales bacterium]